MLTSKDRKEGNREANLMTMFDKIVLRAGLNPWPMPGNNLRGSLVTDLYNGKYPELGLHTIAAWIGHSPEIAMKHYTRIRDEDFEKVRPKSVHSKTNNVMDNALSVETPEDKLQKSIVQKRVQSASVNGGNSLKTTEIDIFTKKQKQVVTSNDYNELQPVSTSNEIINAYSKSDLIPPRGIDENSITIGKEKRYIDWNNLGCAKTCAFSDISAFLPDDRQALETIIKLWPELPSEVKINILKIIEAVRSSNDNITQYHE